MQITARIHINWTSWRILSSLFNLLSMCHLRTHQHVNVSSLVLLMPQPLQRSGGFTLFSYLFLFRLKNKATLKILTKTPPRASGPFCCLSPERLTHSPIPGPGSLVHKRALQVDLSGVFIASLTGGCLGQRTGSDTSDLYNREGEPNSTSLWNYDENTSG